MTAKVDFYHWRIFATGASFALFGIGGVILGYLVFPLVSLFSATRDVTVRHCRSMVSSGFAFFVWFMKTFGVLTWEVEGRELLDEPGVLVVANHPTLIDIVFIISMIPNASCIVKPSLYKSVFTRGPVSRAAYVASDEPETLIDDCVNSLGEGASLVIFPEGTRSVKGQPLRFRRGAAHVQNRTGCAVLLVKISSVPPTLAKHEKWYQIPASRPHFKLVVERDEGALRDLSYDGLAADPRVTTRRWLDYFSSEVTV